MADEDVEVEYEAPGAEAMAEYGDGLALVRVLPSVPIDRKTKTLLTAARRHGFLSLLRSRPATRRHAHTAIDVDAASHHTRTFAPMPARRCLPFLAPSLSLSLPLPLLHLSLSLIHI